MILKTLNIGLSSFVTSVLIFLTSSFYLIIRKRENLYPIDILFLCLKVDLALGAPCPKLSHLYIDPYQNYNPNTLAEVLLSRRMASKVVNVSWEGGQGDAISCAELTVYIDGGQIDQFRAAEERVLSKCSESIVELVGRAKILKLEEWEDDWYDV